MSKKIQRVETHFSEKAVAISEQFADYVSNCDRFDPRNFTGSLKQVYNKDFMQRVMVCIFVPFLHPETPKVSNLERIVDTDKLVPDMEKMKTIFAMREKIMDQEN